jgi:peptidoglycan hydrolase CwlO-like protein|tara:strand:- start:59 stop:355 length:297 start_codon:yes stop_codon:yes gene_type:complete
MEMEMIAAVLVAILIFLVICTPIVLLTILIIRTNKPKAPVNKVKLEQLEQNDYQIADDVNKAFTDFAADLEKLNTRLDGLEEKLDRDASEIKGFNSKR